MVALIPDHVVNAFIDCFGGTYIRDIKALFEDYGALGFDTDAQAGYRGERRSFAAGYVAALDLSDPKAVSILLEIMSDRLKAWDVPKALPDPDLDRLKKT